MKKSKRFLLLASAMMISVMFVACGKAEDTNTKQPQENAGNEVAQGKEEEAYEEIVEFSEWEGTWNNIVDYLDDEELEEAFEDLAEREGMTVEETKDEFIEDRKIDYSSLIIEGNKATFLDGFKDKGGKEIEEMEYEYKKMLIAKHGNFDEEWFLFEAVEEGKYNVLLMMPVHGEEALTHFHMRHGNSAEELLALEDWYPTLVKPNSTYDQLYEEIIE